MERLQVKIKRLHPDAVIPKYAHEGDAGFDLVAVEDVVVEPGETAKVPTGIAIELPPGYELQVRPRSGISLRTKLRVVLGTVDAGYRGEIGVIVDNIAQKEYYCRGKNQELGVLYDENAIGIDGRESVTGKSHPAGTCIIRKGDRIAQGVIAPVSTADFVEVEKLSDTTRGNGGFGSTGVKDEHKRKTIVTKDGVVE